MTPTWESLSPAFARLAGRRRNVSIATWKDVEKRTVSVAVMRDQGGPRTQVAWSRVGTSLQRFRAASHPKSR